MPAPISTRATSATTKAAAVDSKALAKESAAIVSFIEKNWDVKLKKGTLPQLVNDVLKEGTQLGDRFGKAELRDRLESANRTAKLAGVLNGAAPDPKPLKLPLDAPPAAEFGPAAEALEKALGKKFGVDAKPKGKLPSDEYAEPVEKPFSGSQLHGSLAASIGGFSQTLSPQTVKYNLVRDRSAVNTLVSAILRQGMTLQLNELDQTYGKQIDAFQKKAVSEMDRIANRDGFHR